MGVRLTALQINTIDAEIGDAEFFDVENTIVDDVSAVNVYVEGEKDHPANFSVSPDGGII